MANTWIKATKVVSTALGVLEREIVLPQLVWKDAVGDFAGAADDTISIRIPAYVTSRSRTLRAAGPLTMDEMAECKIDVTLDKDIYKGVNISDEDLTLDITDFGAQIVSPIVRAIAMGVEDELADTITGATYTHEVTLDTDAPYTAVLEARKKLNDSHVPPSQRVLLVGSTIEQYILEALAGRESGTTMEESALADATLVRNYGGFRVVQSSAIPPDEAYAFHRTAFVLCSRAPKIPAGATWGASQSYAGLAMRLIKDYDPLYIRDRCIGSVYVGTEVVTDNGELNSDGQFVPYEDADDISSGTPILVRAVKITVGS